jgi:ribosome-binding factor A
MTSRRQQRVAELIHKEISTLLQFDAHDPRIGFVTVTEVEVTPDLKEAIIYISLLSGDEKEVLAGLKSATPFFRRELGRRVNLRYTPALNFRLDRSLNYAQQIDNLLSQIDIPAESNDALEVDDLSGLDDGS